MGLLVKYDLISIVDVSGSSVMGNCAPAPYSFIRTTERDDEFDVI